jgi:HEAT repeat protein
MMPGPRLLLLLALALLLLPSEPLHAENFLGRSAEQWAGELDHSSATRRRSAAFALGRIGPLSQRFLPRLLEQSARDSNPSVRAAAAMAVGDIVLDLGDQAGTTWPDLVPGLRERLGQEKDPGVRRGLAYALGAFGPAAEPAVALLREALKDTSPSVRQNAAWALGRLGQKAGGEAVRQLIPLLKDTAVLVRRDAAGALGDIGLPLAREAVPALLDLVDLEGDSAVLKTALEKLYHLVGPDLQSESARFYPHLKSEDPEFARAAAFVLVQMHPPVDPYKETALVEALRPAVPVLRQALLDDEDPLIQKKAAAGLGQLGPTAVDAVADLIRVLTTSPEEDVRLNAALALGYIGPAAKNAIPALLKALAKRDHETVDVRARYVEAISFLHYPANAQAIPALLDILETEKARELRRMCVIALGDVDFGTFPKAEPVLTKILDETDTDSLIVRYMAAAVLARKLRENAPDKVIPTLLHMLKNTNLRQDDGTKTKAGGTGESNLNQPSVTSGLSGDGRFIPADALGRLRKKGNRPEVIQALEEASKDANVKLQETARTALKQIRGS